MGSGVGLISKAHTTGLLKLINLVCNSINTHVYTCFLIAETHTHTHTFSGAGDYDNGNEGWSVKMFSNQLLLLSE